MAATKQLIGTVTVGAGGAADMGFSSIPQTFTDLLLVFSARTNFSGFQQDLAVFFNNNGAGYTRRRLYGNGSGVFSDSASATPSAVSVAASATSNTFSNGQIYIPNYRASQNKSTSIDGVSENNGTSGFLVLDAGLWSNTAAITDIVLNGAGQTLQQYSTASLYGITSGNGGATVS